MMEPRLNPFTVAPALAKQYVDYSHSIIASGLEPDLLHLVEIRASQINGCANCLNMHTAAARKGGESEQRLHLLAAWEEADGLQTTALLIDDGRIKAIYVMRNPDKLRHLESTIH